MSGILFGRTRRGPQASSSGLGATLGPTKNMGLGARVAMPQYSQEILEAQMENEPAKLFHVLQDCEGPDRSIEAREKIQGLWVEGGRRGQTAEVSFPHGIHIPPPTPRLWWWGLGRPRGRQCRAPAREDPARAPPGPKRFLNVI